MDGPVVKAAQAALQNGNVNLILPYVPRSGESEVKKAFKKALIVRKAGGEPAELADHWFFETAVRVHRAGEGAAYTGLRPAGLDWGPVAPKAEKAIEQGDAEEVIHFITHTVEHELHRRFEEALHRKNYDVNDVAAAREYVHAYLGFVLYSQHLYTAITGAAEHDEAEGSGHEH